MKPTPACVDEPVQPREQRRPDRRPGPATARTALRSCPIAVAACSPRPTTSPTATASTSSSSRNASYQSPPTSSAWTPGRYSVVTAEPVVDRQVGGEQGALQLVGDRRLLVEQLRALQRQPRLLPDGGEHPDVERVVARGQDERAARGVRRTERHDDDAAGVQLDGVGRGPVGGVRSGARAVPGPRARPARRCPRRRRHRTSPDAPACRPRPRSTRSPSRRPRCVTAVSTSARATPSGPDALRQGRRRRLQRAELVRGPVRGRPRGEQLALVPRALRAPGTAPRRRCARRRRRCARPPT